MATMSQERVFSLAKKAAREGRTINEARPARLSIMARGGHAPQAGRIHYRGQSLTLDATLADRGRTIHFFVTPPASPLILEQGLR